MGIMDFVKGGVRELMIARPDDKKSLIVYKHPNQNIPFGSQLTVDSDEAAVFFKDGRVVGVLPPGPHTLHSSNIPFLNYLVTQFTGGNLFITEIYFVKTQPVRDIPFGGPIGEMIDPLTQEMCTPRMFGKFSLVVVDPARFIVGYAGQAAGSDNDQLLDWIKGLFFLGVKTVIGELCETEGKSIVQAVSMTQTLAQRFVQRAPNLEDIGVRVLQMGNFNINFSPEERQRLVEAQGEVAKAQRGVRIARAEAEARQFELDQRFGQDARYVQQLAGGSWQNYAGGKAMIGAGEGMAQGGADVGLAASGAQMAVGVGLAGMMHGQMPYQQPPQVPPMPPAQGAYGPPPNGQGPMAASSNIACPKCNAQVPPGRFCAECGTPLAAQKRFCANCGKELGATAKFCANCGQPAPAG